MPEKPNSHGAMDPMDLWKQWNTSTSAMWSNMAGGNKEALIDPFGLYQAWIKGVEEAQEQLKAGSAKSLNLEEFWKNWFESMIASWRKAAESGPDPLGLTARWLDLMEEARAKMFSSGTMPTDPFTFYKQWYDAISETWSKVVGDLIGTEEFTKASSKFLENYLNFVKSSRRINEEYFKNLQIPTLSDIARVAELIVLLEDKVDKIADAVEDFSDHFGQLATTESITDLASRVDGLENQLTALPATIEQGNALTGLANRMNGLDSRLDGVESTLTALPAAIENGNALSSLTSRLAGVEQKLTTMETVLEGVNSLPTLAGRLNQVESKLDKVLAALERIDTKGQQPAPVKPANTTPRRSKKSAKPAEDTSTSANTSVK
nr:hypothetical protein [Ktedonobacteraceae bacterium]